MVCGRMWYEGVVCGVRKSDTWKDTLREGWGEVYTHIHPCNYTCCMHSTHTHTHTHTQSIHVHIHSTHLYKPRPLIPM